MIRKLLILLPFLGALAFGQTVPKNVTKAGGTNIISEDLVFDSRILTLNTAIVFGDGNRQTFNPNGTAAGLNVGAHTADPSSLVNGDIWYNSTSNVVKIRANGATASLGTGTGDVVGPGASTDARLALFDSTTGKLIKQSTALTESGGTITSNTAIGLTAGGSNQSITLTPTGTGTVTSAGLHSVTFNSSSTSPGGLTLENTNSAGRATVVVKNNSGVMGSIGTYGSTFTSAAYRNILAIGATNALQFTSDAEVSSGGSNTIKFVTGGFDNSASITIAAGNPGAVTVAGVLNVTGAIVPTTTITFPDGVRQTFNPDGTAAGINVGSHASDPSTPSNGDLWYDSTAHELTARINGSNVALGAGGGGSVATDTIWDAKGDLAVGTGANTSARLAIGANGTIPIADSAEATGIRWGTPSGGGTLTLARFNALDAQPPASNYAQFRTRNSIAVLDYDAATDESTVFVSSIPEAADFTTGIAVRIYWIATSATSGDVVWNTSFERGTTDLDTDSFATAVAGTATTNGTSGIITVTTINHSGSEIDGLVAGDAFRFRLLRDADNGSDTMTGDAEVVAVELRQR